MRERVAQALRDAKKDLGYPGLHLGPTDHDYAQADAVLAAIDPDKVRDEGRREAAKGIAYRIEAELVCCDVYEQHAQAGTYDETVHGHALCYWGEASARIARGFVGQERRCACPDIDVSTWADQGKGVRRVVKGLDADCSEHGKGTIREGT